jgi:long-chain fatty acid transport protein
MRGGQTVRKTLLFVLLIFLVIGRASAWAGGLYLSEVSNADVALASAGWAARAQDASTLFTNPAGMTRLKQPEVLFGLQPFYVHLDFESDSNTSAGNQFRPNGSHADSGDASTWMPAGGTFYVHPVNKQLSLGIGVFGYFGLAVDYDSGWVGRYYAKEAKLQGLNVMPAAAYRVNDWLSFGAGLNAMYGILNQKIAVNNNPGGIGEYPDGELELDDKVWGFGGVFGVLMEPSQRTRFGLTYMTKIELDFETDADFSGLRPALQAILGNKGLLDTKLKLPVNAPQSVMLSAYHEINDRWAIMGNVGWQDWSEFGSIDVTVSAEDTNSLTVDMNYDDTWHAAAGVQYKVSDLLLLSLGISYNSSMMEDDERTPSVPSGEVWQFGTGVQYKVKKNLDVSVAYELAWLGDLSMDVNRGPLAGRVSGDYTNTSMHFINLALNWRF